MTTLLYIGSNHDYEEKLKEGLLKFGIVIYFINTKDYSIIECVDKIRTYNDFDAYLIQIESLFKDENSMLSNSDGITLIKHILLTEELGLKRQKKIFGISFYNHHYHIKKSADNSVLFAPEVTLMDIIHQPEKSANKMKNLIESYNRDFFKEEEMFERNLNNYINWTSEDRRSISYSSKNLIGIQKVYREYFNNTEDYDQKMNFLMENSDNSVKNEFQELWFKKKRFKLKVEQNRTINQDKIQSKLNSIHKSRIKKVLVIEDNWYWIDFFSEIFAKEQVDFITDYDDANLKLSEIGINFINSASINFDLIIIDLKLTDKEESVGDDNKGINLAILSEIKSLNKNKSFKRNLPLIVISETEDPEITRHVYKTGVDGYFIKDRDNLNYLLDIICDNLNL